MTDLTPETPATEVATPIEPLTSSADGKRNSFTLYCVTKGQSMNYAACLWRQNVLAGQDIKTPADWEGCKTACKSNACTALMMRQEEELAGKSIYFQCREIVRKAADSLRQWMPSYAPKEKPAKSHSSHSGASAAPKTDMLDAIGHAGSFADAITVAAKTPSAPVTAMAGETPLQMARRLQAQRHI